MKIFRNLFIFFLIGMSIYFVCGETIMKKDSPGFREYYEKLNDGWSYRLENGKTGDIEVPGKCDARPKELVIFENVLPENMNKLTACLVIRSQRQDMEIYIDGVLRNTYSTKKTRLFDKNSAVADVITVISPEDAGKSILIKTWSDSSASGRLVDVAVGNQIGVFMRYLKVNGPVVLFAFITFLFSMVCLIISIILSFVYKRRIELGYLTVGVSLASVWIIVNSAMRQISFTNVSMVSDMAFLVIMVLPYPFILYMDSIQSNRYRKAYYALGTIVSVNFVVDFILHATKLVDFSRTIIVSAGVCGLVIVTLGFNIYRDFRTGKIKEYGVLAFGIFMTFICAVLQIGAYFLQNDKFDGSLLALGLACLLIVSCFDAGKKIINAEKERTQAVLAKEAKSRFLANMSHEIRTPINAVLGMNEMILRSSNEAQVKEYSIDIKAAGETLLSIINDILDTTKIESGKMELVLVEYDFCSMIHDVITMFDGKARDKGLELELNIDEGLPSRLYGDDVRIRQILTNLCSNAVKYTEKGKITISISGCTEGNEIVLRFSVKDTGMGIREQDIDKLFAAFERLEESRNRNIEGTGLGINIVMQLLKLMDSKLEVSSEYGIGSDFSFCLKQKIVNPEPIGDFEKRMKRRTAEKTYKCGFVAPNARILVVDDNSMNRKVFCNVLKDNKLHIDEAESGKKCIELIQENFYDIVFLDHMMPHMDGIETLKIITDNKLSKNENVIIIALTANAIAGAKEMYIEKGFTDFLSKPLSLNKLETQLIKYIPKDKIKLVTKSGKETNDKTDGYEKKLNEVSEAIPELNMEYARLITKGSEDMYMLLKDFYNSMSHEISIIEELLEMVQESEKMKSFRIKIHALKSSSAMIGAMAIHGVAKVLEDSAKNSDIEAVKGITPLFIKQWNDLRKGLEEFFAEKTDEENLKNFDEGEIILYITNIKNALEDMDVDTADEIVEILRKYRYEGQWQERISKVYEATTNLDSQAIGEILENI